MRIFRNDEPLLPVENPKIGEKYHLSWARKRGMVWVLIEINGTTAVLQTPKTKKRLTSHISTLLHTRAQQFRIEQEKAKKASDISS